jgi:hypothetical protein
MSQRLYYSNFLDKINQRMRSKEQLFLFLLLLCLFINTFETTRQEQERSESPISKLIPSFRALKQQNAKQQIINCASYHTQPCLNGGSCLNTLKGYVCACLSNYTGILCQYSLFNCQSGPCRNGGTCVETLGSFTCQCQTGYTGKLCQSVINNCASEPCFNQATCTSNIGGYTCTCPPGYTGTRCDIIINYCYSDPCKNSAQCVNQPDGYSCDCSYPFVGDDCERNSGCDIEPCFNNGTCDVQTLTPFFKCSCPNGFSGSRFLNFYRYFVRLSIDELNVNVFALKWCEKIKKICAIRSIRSEKINFFHHIMKKGLLKNRSFYRTNFLELV